jgi:AcrR family transcriptional regulator
MTDRSVAKDSLLPALAETFRRHGYDGASLTTLARATGLQKASLYHHFPGGKQAMAEAVLDAVAADFDAYIFAPLNGPGPLADRLTAMMAALEDQFDGGTQPGIFAALAEGPQRDLFAPRIAKFYGRWINSLGAALVETGLSVEDAVRGAADTITAIEGAMVLSRGLSDTGPFQRVLRHLEEDLIARAPAE